MGDDVRMGRVDEPEGAVDLDANAVARLVDALAASETVAAFVFGSYARGTAGPLSDLDVGVWLRPALGRDARLDLRLALASRAERAVGGEVDLVVLQDASPLLVHHALKDRRWLFDADPVVRMRLEVEAVVEFLDTAPLRATVAAGVEQRLREGRFGRS